LGLRLGLGTIRVGSEEQKVKNREEREPEIETTAEEGGRAPDILEEIEIEEFAVDGICGVY